MLDQGGELHIRASKKTRGGSNAQRASDYSARMQILESPVGLIGFTGFVGGTLMGQAEFDFLYRRRNVHELAADRPATVVCAGAPAAKWLANQKPREDRQNLNRLISALDDTPIRRLILISTVDVYPDPTRVDESSPIDPASNHSYGRHRFHLERFVRERFDQTTVIRLPALFGRGLKKNFVFDLLNDRPERFTHRDSAFQFYDISRLWLDLLRIVASGLELVNLVGEPVKAREVARHAFGIDYDFVTDADPVAYDIRTRHAERFGAEGVYMFSASETLDRLRTFVASERSRYQ